VRLVVWNCKQGLARKMARLVELDFDVAVIPEAGQRVPAANLTGWAWTGRNPQKGLGVATRGDYAIGKVFDHSNCEWLLPLEICRRGAIDAHLLAVWAMNHRSSAGAARNPVIEALQVHAQWLSERRSLIAGDFNANVVFDRRRNDPRNFRHKTAALDRLGYRSAYHASRDIAFGEEPEPTLLWNYKRPYHVDFAFLPKQVAGRARVRVLSFADWRELSDHVPVVVEFTPTLPSEGR
jgi:hypothetical protein